MAAHSVRQVTRSWYEVVLPNPCLRGDLLEAKDEVEKRFQLYTGLSADSWDDSYEIEGVGDEMIMRFEVKKEDIDRTDSFTEGFLARAVELLAVMVTPCAMSIDGTCISHEKVRGQHDMCPHALARELIAEINAEKGKA